MVVRSSAPILVQDEERGYTDHVNALGTPSATVGRSSLLVPHPLTAASAGLHAVCSSLSELKCPIHIGCTPKLGGPS